MPQFGTWSVPNCPLAIEYDLDILETIRREVSNGFHVPRGGVEVGGLLLGAYDGKRLRITGFEPVGCDHALGPRFILNENETAALDSQLAAHKGQSAPNGEAVVGWYQSHLRRGLTLSSEDVQIYDRHFSEPWQVALLLRPDPAGGIHARFFIREPGTPLGQTPSSTSSRRVERPRLVREPAQTLPLEAAAGYPPDAMGPAAALGKRGIQNNAVWTVLATMFVLAVVSVFYLRFNFAVTPRAVELLHLEAIAGSNGLELRWDPKQLGNASRGRLEIRDGPTVQQVALDRETLGSGRFIYRQKSDVIGFRIEAERTAGVPLEGSALYVARNFESASPAQALAPAASTGTVIPSPAASMALATPPPVAPFVQSDTLKARPDASRPPAPPVVPPAVSGADEQPKPTAPASTVTAPPKQEEPPKPKPEQAVAATPVQTQTAQIPRPTAPELPAPVQSPPVRLEPAPAPATSAPRVIPKETASAPTPAASPSWPLTGRWILQSGGYSRSPAVPESVTISVSETDGSVQGTLEARYKARSKGERIHFSFAGKMVNGSARFSWTSVTGKRGQIEFIRVPNSPDVAEVVWQNPENNNVFDEMLRRAK
jgi:proteasome lid subunit RPN8/RPN11